MRRLSNDAGTCSADLQVRRLGRPEGLHYVLLLCLAFAAVAVAQQKQYAVKGMVTSVNQSAKTFTASIEAIPGFMQAMTMPFEVRQSGDLDGLSAGAIVEFTLVVDKKPARAGIDPYNKLIDRVPKDNTMAVDVN